MERIELFDKYVNGQLSVEERSTFDSLLESDPDFASDFKIYLLSVDGICREAHQDNLDFGLAMKSISKDQLKKIIGKPDTERRKPTSKTHRLKPWMWQTASIAAILIIAFTVVLNIEKNARYSVDNAIYTCADIDSNLARSGGETIDIRSLNDDELKAHLQNLISLYQTASTTDEIADNGYVLAMAYLRLHDRNNATIILEQLVSKFDGNTDYVESVNTWKSIINILK